ncbi:MAG: monovalent cation/H+ antiporter complex subunit F [Kiritimatiellia bacterium]|nr:monovalent cation/H+ antiporter complex subunit F [Kiritimatiellia bacterium]
MNAAEMVLMGFLVASLYRLAAGPSFYDRLLSLHLVSAQVILLMCFHAVRTDRQYYVDVALIYAMLSFAETVAFVRFTRPTGVSSA